MSCPICYKDNCTKWMHNLEEIYKYEKRLEDFRQMLSKKILNIHPNPSEGLYDFISEVIDVIDETDF